MVCGKGPSVGKKVKRAVKKVGRQIESEVEVPLTRKMVWRSLLWPHDFFVATVAYGLYCTIVAGRFILWVVGLRRSHF